MIATNKRQQLILLEHDRAQMLDELAKKSRIPKQVLLREAVEDLLEKHGAAVPGLTNAGLAIVSLKEAIEYARGAAQQLRGSVWVTRSRSLLKNAAAAVERLEAYTRGESRLAHK